MSHASDSIRYQLERIIALGYPHIADMSANAFRDLAQPLLTALESETTTEEVLLVPTAELVSPDSLISRTAIGTHVGFTTMPPRDIESFTPNSYMPPEGPFYILIGPHIGTEYINREPDVARKLMEVDGREPLSLEEGLALATQHPEWLTQNGFNMLASRSADGRIPSIWISQNSPRLASVWPMSKHSWIGNAYCIARRGVSLLS